MVLTQGLVRMEGHKAKERKGEGGVAASFLEGSFFGWDAQRCGLETSEYVLRVS